MKKISLLVLCLMLVATLAACSANANPTPTLTPMATATPMPGVTNGVNPNPTATDDAAMTAAMTGAESTALSKKANEAASKISEIDSCVTAIIGDTCVAGVTFDPRYQGAMTDRIRDMVSTRIQSAAPIVDRVVVTNDPEIAAQISTVAEKISKATALGDLTGELDAVMGMIR